MKNYPMPEGKSNLNPPASDLAKAGGNLSSIKTKTEHRYYNQNLWLLARTIGDTVKWLQQHGQSYPYYGTIENDLEVFSPDQIKNLIGTLFGGKRCPSCGSAIMIDRSFLIQILMLAVSCLVRNDLVFGDESEVDYDSIYNELADTLLVISYNSICVLCGREEKVEAVMGCDRFLSVRGNDEGPPRYL